jgi:hypothetical protein
MVEFEYGDQGLAEAKQYRKDHPEFKYRHIMDIIQAYPSKIELGKEYFLT